MKYEGKQYTIPINIILPIGFPYTAPKVYLAYKLDSACAKANPLIVNESEVMNNFLHKWQGNSPQYNLGALCYNLTKSFEIHPPLGEAPKEEKKTIIDKVGSVTSSVYSSIKENVNKATGGAVFKNNTVHENGDHSTTSAMSTGTTAATSVKTPEMKQREERIEKVTEKLSIKFVTLNDYFEEGKNEIDQNDNYLTRAKAELDENSMKLNTQILVLQGEKEEMKERINEMAQFVAKNKDKEVTKVYNFFLIFFRTTSMILSVKKKPTNKLC